jgi:CheY-like chemotaxis protein
MGRILVADDHDSLRRGIVRALSDAHHEVDEAPNGTSPSRSSTRGSSTSSSAI